MAACLPCWLCWSHWSAPTGPQAGVAGWQASRCAGPHEVAPPHGHRAQEHHCPDKGCDCWPRVEKLDAHGRCTAGLRAGGRRAIRRILIILDGALDH